MRTAKGLTLITNGQLVDGTGAPAVADAAVVDPGRADRATPGRWPARPRCRPTPRGSTPAAARSCPGWSRPTSIPTYFNVAELADLDIKYPVEYVTLLAAANARLALECGYTAARSGGSLHQHRRLAEEGDRGGPGPRPAPGRQRPRDLRRRRADGLEPRLPASSAWRAWSS